MFNTDPYFVNSADDSFSSPPNHNTCRSRERSECTLSTSDGVGEGIDDIVERREKSIL
jgi:hypothetical protein